MGVSKISINERPKNFEVSENFINFAFRIALVA